MLMLTVTAVVPGKVIVIVIVAGCEANRMC